MDTNYKNIMDHIIRNPQHFVSWPKKSLLLLPGITRETKYHQYPESVKQQLRSAGIPPDGRSNGPAICSFLLAGGIRPQRETGKGWNIHHIYDGKFPHVGNTTTMHAIRDGQYFTEAAGLVALHPLADAMADEFAEFSWWLRRDAYNRFGLDPDQVFILNSELGSDQANWINLKE
jgi:hypothetical protein